MTLRHQRIFFYEGQNITIPEYQFPIGISTMEHDFPMWVSIMSLEIKCWMYKEHLTANCNNSAFVY